MIKIEETIASRSAAIIAAHRAMESAKPSDERICYDPYAEKLIPPNVTVIGETALPKEQALNLFKNFGPGFHEYFIARTRYIDDYLTSCIGKELQQLVILGAGYDSRAYRFDFTSPEVVQGTEERPEAKAWLQKTSDAGEPLKFGIRFDALESLLAKSRFGKISYATHDYFNRAHFHRPEDKRAATPILAIVHASLIS